MESGSVSVCQQSRIDLIHLLIFGTVRVHLDHEFLVQAAKNTLQQECCFLFFIEKNLSCLIFFKNDNVSDACVKNSSFKA